MSEASPILGRDRELTTILERLNAGVGTVVLGDPGIGKSTLALGVQQRLRAVGAPTLFVACTVLADAVFAAIDEELTGSDDAIVIVDDAHLMDEEATQHLWRLASTASLRVVATARTGERTPNGVTRLWTEGICDRLDLGVLAEPDVGTLLRRWLNGAIEPRLPGLLAHRAAGNPLLVRELIQAGVRAGTIAVRGGAWQLVGDLPSAVGLTDLIRSAVAGLASQEAEAVQLIALAEPVRLGLAERLIEPDVLESLESKQVIVAGGADEPELSCAHPLYGEVVRTDLPELRARRLRTRLVDAIATYDRSTPRERLQAVLWRLELNQDVPAEQLLGAAQIARRISRSSAEPLASAAVSAGAGNDACLLLAELLLPQGRIAEADSALDRIDPATLTEEQKPRYTSSRVIGRTRLGEIADALSLTGADLATSSVQLQALHAQSLLLNGAPQAALRVAEPLAFNPAIEPVASSVAAYTVVAAHSFLGRDADADQAMRAALPVVRATTDVLPYASAIVQVSAATSRVLAGRLIDGERLGYEMQEAAIHQDDPWLRPRSATALGLAALLRGRVRTAAEQLRIAISALNELDTMFLPYNVSFFARATALTGDTAAARRALDLQTDAPRYPLYEADWQIAQAAVLAADGRLEAAAAQALSAARTAAGRGQWGIAALAAHDATRYNGSPAAVELTGAAADQTGALLPRLLAEHADARAGADPNRLAAVSDQFEQRGVLLFAAEAAYASARAHRRRGNASAAVRLSIRAADLHGRCENAAIPWALGRPAASLTQRQQQVALLAAAGHPDNDIGITLGITVRTVQAHLTQVYAKLQISSRRDIAATLTARSSWTPDP